MNIYFNQFVISKNLRTKNVIKGKNGWLFHWTPDAINMFTRRNNLGTGEIEKLVEYLVDINNYCKKHNKNVYVSSKIGIAEMFLPVLIIQNKIDILTLEARAFVCLVSMCQIIFFSETATVMLATKSPIKFKEIVICFIERTILAIPLAALCIHLFF